MSYEGHKQAMKAWEELNELDPALRLDVLAEEDNRFAVPCSAALSGMVFRKLGIEVEDWCVLYTKLYQRPVSKVFRLYEVASETKPEQYAGLLTNFARRVPAMESEAA